MNARSILAHLRGFAAFDFCVGFLLFLDSCIFDLPRTPCTLYAAYRKEALGSFEPRASAVAGHFIKIFEQKSSIANRNPYSGFALSAMMESRYWRGVKPVCLRNTR